MSINIEHMSNFIDLKKKIKKSFISKEIIDLLNDYFYCCTDLSAFTLNFLEQYYAKRLINNSQFINAGTSLMY